MKPTQLSQKQLEVLREINDIVEDGLKQLEYFEADSAAMDEKWKKIAQSKRDKDFKTKL